MRKIVYLLIGVFFGIVLYKSEAASWFRIYEMFRFESFHMYGIIISAILVGIVLVQLIKRYKLRSIDGEPIAIPPKDFSIKRYLFGGIIFGLGWALVGACPGPMFTLVGVGYIPILVVIVFAVIGTYLYGAMRSHLPH